PPAPAAAAPAAAPTEVCRVPVTIPDKGTALQAALTTTQPTTPSVEAIRSYTLYQAKNFVPSRVSARQSAMEAGAASRSRGLDGPEVRDRNLLSFLQLLNDGSRALAEQGEASAARSRAETADQQTELERARRIALATIDNGLRLATNQINHAKTELIKSVHQAQHRARKALRTQARSARTGLLTAAPAMADQYREAIHRLHQTTPPGQLLDIRRLGPRLRALEQGAHRQLPQQLQLLTRQAQEGYRGARRAVDEQCKGIREIATSGQESFDSMRSSTSMQFYLESNAIVGRMTAGGADTVREATGHAERTLVRQAPHPDKVKKAVKKWLGDNFSAAFNSLVGDFATTYSRSANSMPRDLGMGGSDGSISVSPPGPERTLLHEVSTAVATELNTQAGALMRAAPSRSTVGAVALTVLSPVGGAYYIYSTRSNGDDAINAISAVPTWGRPGLEQRFFEREGTSLRERLQDRLLSGKWAIARALLDGRNSDAADLALRNEVHWYGVNETTRNNILRSLSSSERTALTTNDPARWATTQKILSDNMSAEQLAITTSYVDRGRDAIMARDLDRRLTEARQSGAEATVNLIRGMEQEARVAIAGSFYASLVSDEQVADTMTGIYREHARMHAGAGENVDRLDASEVRDRFANRASRSWLRPSQGANLPPSARDAIRSTVMQGSEMAIPQRSVSGNAALDRGEVQLARAERREQLQDQAWAANANFRIRHAERQGANADQRRNVTQAVENRALDRASVELERYRSLNPTL
ncbi:MAG TPA: hypothetical protein PLA94_18815, partial [Myxococcota bacterium]|nr:hypothetical protein [Myxococcota bacterium]